MILLGKRRTVVITLDELNSVLDVKDNETIRFVGIVGDGAARLPGALEYIGEDGRKHNEAIKGDVIFEIEEVRAVAR